MLYLYKSLNRLLNVCEIEQDVEHRSTGLGIEEIVIQR